jgi:polynucleotide 5'-hydroxyl-kinase GRC3/NOL9
VSVVLPDQAAAGISLAAQEASAGGRPPVIAVCGTKGAGKSSFGRLLANALLNWAPRVAWLDTDPGQPEFTVPGALLCTLKPPSCPSLSWCTLPDTVGSQSLRHDGSQSIAAAVAKRRWAVSRHTADGALGVRAGLVSLTLLDRPLYGLPHMHRRPPARAHFLGALSAERDPTAYSAAVRALLAWHSARPGAGAPLIINSCGWIKVGAPDRESL